MPPMRVVKCPKCGHSDKAATWVIACYRCYTQNGRIIHLEEVKGGGDDIDHSE